MRKSWHFLKGLYMQLKPKQGMLIKFSIIFILGSALELQSANGDMLTLDDALRKPDALGVSNPSLNSESARKQETLPKPLATSESVISHSQEYQEFHTPILSAQAAMVYDEREQRSLYSKNAKNVVPIASITKLMTAMVVLDAHLPMNEKIRILQQDKSAVDKIKKSRSRLTPGMIMTRGELIKLALMSSDNRAAAVLARTYPGGMNAAVAQMNVKARKLNMDNSRFLEPTGLNSGNVSTAQDLVKMVLAAQEYEPIHQATTTISHDIKASGRKQLQFHNTNPLVKNADWNIYLSKTGFINRAGRCLVMKANIHSHPVVIVLLDSKSKLTRTQDAISIMDWIGNV